MPRPLAVQAMTHFRSGVRNKFMASHAMNMASSRSHAIFSIVVNAKPAMAAAASVGPGAGLGDGGVGSGGFRSRLSLVDLAGSERASFTGATGGQLLQESIFINKSLFTLRKVITALAEPRYRGLHVPYRDSKLTALLKVRSLCLLLPLLT